MLVGQHYQNGYICDDIDEACPPDATDVDDDTVVIHRYRNQP